VKVTYPHMGNIYIVIRALLGSLGVELVLPPPTSKRTVELGVRYAPEFACFPLKLNLGNFIEAHELGADTILMGGGVGPCRFGYYAQVEAEILRDLGLDMQMVVLEPPDLGWREVLDKIHYLVGELSWWQIFKACRFAWYKARAVDEVEAAMLKLRPRLTRTQPLEELCRATLQRIDWAASRRSLEGITRSFQSDCQKMPSRCGDLMRVGLVGEIFTILEPFANFDIERRLGCLGVEVDRSIYLSAWINTHLLGGLLRVKREESDRLAPPYLNAFVGGHAQETVGSTVEYARRDYDGVVQVAPLTCMPEIVAHSILPAVKRDYDIPTLTFYLDEQAGEAGIQTRLEAFIDLLVARRAKRKENH